MNKGRKKEGRIEHKNREKRRASIFFANSIIFCTENSEDSVDQK